MNLCNNKIFCFFVIVFQRLVESDSEGSLRDFIDDDNETTESSDNSSSDESQAVKEGAGSNHKPISRNTRSKRNNNPVEGEHTVHVLYVLMLKDQMCLVMHIHSYKVC
jgi:hypothetical protein